MTHCSTSKGPFFSDNYQPEVDDDMGGAARGLPEATRKKTFRILFEIVSLMSAYVNRVQDKWTLVHMWATVNRA